MLRRLANHYGAPQGLDAEVRRVDQPDHRNITISKGDKDKLLAAASASIRCYILLCSDLAIRSGTAVKIAPQNFDKEKNRLNFTTKKGKSMSLPVTSELRSMFLAAEVRCPPERPYVSFFSTKGTCGRESAYDNFRRLKRRLGIDDRITPHDLRRTTAIAVLETTGDIREVQAALGHKRLTTTVQYLGGSLSSVSNDVLELAKLHPLTERPQ